MKNLILAIVDLIAKWIALPALLTGLWNTIAYNFNLPTFNFIFFLGCIAVVWCWNYNPEKCLTNS
jgi:RsiW-degrading membrane proteinase PrsW (M82 family)